MYFMILNVKTLVLPPIGTRCYIAGDGNDAFVVDPASSADEIFVETAKTGMKIRAILLTHGHFDHIGAVDELVRLTGADVYIHALDKQMISDGYLNVSRLFFGEDIIQNSDVKTVGNGDVITVGSIKIAVMHTPGHTAGSVCYFCDDAVFTGDTLFIGGCGRTDLPTGNAEALQKSLALLKETTAGKTIYPGH